MLGTWKKLRSDREKRAGEEEGGDDEALDLDPKSQNVCRVYTVMQVIWFNFIENFGKSRN